MVVFSMMAGVALAFADVKADAQVKPEATTVALVPWRNRWVVEAEVAGTKRKYLFDTGAGLTLVSRATVEAAGCAPWGRLTGFRMMGERGDSPRCENIQFKLGGHTLSPAVVTLINMGKLNPKDAELDGVIGLSLFEDRAITIDFAAGTLTLENDASLAARVPGMRPFPIRLKREVDGLALAVMAEVPSAKGKLYFELDSGNGGTVLVSKPVAQLVGMDPAIEGKQAADFPGVAGFAVKTGDAFTPDMIMDGNLGMPFLRDKVITLDLLHGRAWISVSSTAPRAQAPLPPPTEPVRTK